MIPQRLLAALVTACGLSLAFSSSAQQKSAATITVHADRPGITVSPTLYGVFFEEINRAGEGGLYAEMVQNRSFEDSVAPLAGWSLVKAGDGDGAITIDNAQPLNDRN